ncbi:MAG: hypothetical protein ACRDVP_10205 [Acidimicrobiales bacterium]
MTEIFAEYADDDRNPLLSQPECRLVFERLSVDPFRLAHVWDEFLPPPLLRSLSAVWGAPLTDEAVRGLRPNDDVQLPWVGWRSAG